MDHYKHTIQIKVENFFKEHIQEPLNELENYVIDFFVSPEKVCTYIHLHTSITHYALHSGVVDTSLLYTLA